QKSIFFITLIVFFFLISGCGSGSASVEVNISPKGGTYDTLPLEVKLECANDKATIYYRIISGVMAMRDDQVYLADSVSSDEPFVAYSEALSLKEPGTVEYYAEVDGKDPASQLNKLANSKKSSNSSRSSQSYNFTQAAMAAQNTGSVSTKKDAAGSSTGNFILENNSIMINFGDTKTLSSVVTILLRYDGASKMYVTNTKNCEGNGAWEPYTDIPTKVWTLEQKEGTATVYAKFLDKNGKETACINDTITVGSSAASSAGSSTGAGTDFDFFTSGSVSINSGASTTYSKNVTLALSGKGAGEMYITNKYGCFTGGTWEPYSESKSWALGEPEYDGKIRVYASFRDSSKNTSRCYSASIDYRELASGKIYFMINAGAKTTGTAKVRLYSFGTGASKMYITNTAGCASGGTWEDFKSPRDWTLPEASNGTSTVYAKFKDSYGGESPCISDSISYISSTISNPELVAGSPCPSGSNWASFFNTIPGYNYFILNYVFNSLGTTIGTGCQNMVGATPLAELMEAGVPQYWTDFGPPAVTVTKGGTAAGAMPGDIMIQTDYVGTGYFMAQTTRTAVVQAVSTDGTMICFMHQYISPSKVSFGYINVTGMQGGTITFYRPPEK
ncbi:MAG: hypothetical protein HQK54_15640, partial [Oligoflexales bacterium]|nr:hypothetical protein [Oligoflexales bacterium]